MTSSVLLEFRDDLAVITLNDPERRNAMSLAMTDRFPEVIDEVGSSRARAIVITGSGKAFCSGGDLSFIHGEQIAPVEIQEKMSSFYPRFLTLLECDIPIVAAVNGHAVGAGMCLALMCDLRVVSESAKMSMPFVKLGIHPGMMATALLERACGASHAADLLFTGRFIQADEALRMGIANRVVPHDQVLDEACALANEIASNAPIALRYLKNGLRELHREAFAAASSWETFAQAMTMTTKDVSEGITAVREKREPKFEGH